MQCNEILKYCVFSRVAHPNSKKTVKTLKEDYNETVPLEKMYHNDGQALSQVIWWWTPALIKEKMYHNDGQAFIPADLVVDTGAHKGEDVS